MNLYWVETEDHHEDWFIVANNPQEAEEWFANAEGYGEEEAHAQCVCQIHFDKPLEVGWPSQTTLERLGAKISVVSGARVVKVAGRTFCEGLLGPMLNELQQKQLELAQEEI